MLLLCFHLPEQFPKGAQRPCTDVPGSAPLRNCRRLTEQDWHLVEQSQEELAALTGWKDGLSELRCLALLEAGGMQGVQQHQQSSTGAGKALEREVGMARAPASPAAAGFGEWRWFWTKWFCQREPQCRVMCSVPLSLTYSCEGVSVIMDHGKLKKTSLILLSLRIHQEDAVRQLGAC